MCPTIVGMTDQEQTATVVPDYALPAAMLLPDGSALECGARTWAAGRLISGPGVDPDPPDNDTPED